MQQLINLYNHIIQSYHQSVNNLLSCSHCNSVREIWCNVLIKQHFLQLQLQQFINLFNSTFCNCNCSNWLPYSITSHSSSIIKQLIDFNLRNSLSENWCTISVRQLFLWKRISDLLKKTVIHIINHRLSLINSLLFGHCNRIGGNWCIILTNHYHHWPSQ